MFNLKELIKTGKTPVSAPVFVLLFVLFLAYIVVFFWLNVSAIVYATSYWTGLSTFATSMILFFLVMKVKIKNKEYKMLPEQVRHIVFVVLNLVGFSWVVFYSNWPLYQVVLLGSSLIIGYMRTIYKSREKE